MPLLDLTLEQYVPCTLHLFMAIMRLLIQLLAKQTTKSEALGAALEVVLTNPAIGIQLPVKPKSDKKDTPYDISFHTAVVCKNALLQCVTS